MPFLTPVVSAARPVTVTEVRADIRSAAPERAGRDYFRIRTMGALPTAAPSRTVQHPAKPVRRAVKAPKRIAAAPRGKRPGTPVVTIAATGRGAAVARWALTQIGKRYVFGTAGPSTYDCSGLSMAAWLRAGVRLPHNAAQQWGKVRHISRSQLAPGDLVFYNGLGHVGIYIGNNQIIHAPNSRTVVKVAPINADPIYGYGRP